MALHKSTLREVLLAAGLWLTASAACAAPQPAPEMPLGPSALPPVGYVAFCERKPYDCGDDPKLVLARAWQADSDRQQLVAALGAARAPSIVEPAALSAAPSARLSPTQEPEAAAVVRATFETSAAFIDPTDEAFRESEARTPRMTPALWSLLNRVDREINGAIEERTDLANYGVEDLWNTPLEDGRHSGDCEDYALEKERALIRAGIPRTALNLAIVETAWNESHAVLLVATSEGEYVLDSLSPWVSPWREAPYHWVRRQVNGDPFNWVMILDHPRAPASKGWLIAFNR